jgi:LPS-assembly protein
MGFQLRAALAFLACSAAPVIHAGDMCPAPPKHSPPPAVPIEPGDRQIHIESDVFTGDMQGHAQAAGRVKVSQDQRTVSANTMTYDYNTGKVGVQGSVDFEDPRLRIKSVDGVYDAIGGADFDKADFQILDRNGRGYAREISVQPDGKVDLEQVRYTTCPVGNQDWMLQASSINLDTQNQEGSGHHVQLRFKGVPIFYTPYISFPVGDERKTGLLFPNFGHSSSNGYQLEVPYYFNLAPNYDVTLTPGFMSARGVQLGEDFRYLTANSHGSITGNFLPDDKQEHGNRTFFHFTDVTDFERGLRFDADITSVSDVNYFSDFTVGSQQTSVTYLERRAEVKYYDDYWRIRGELQNFQTIDSALYDFDRPYSSVPRIDAEGLYPLGGTRLEFVLNTEAAYFLRKNISDTGIYQTATGEYLPTPNGARVDLSPELRWSIREAGYFFEPSAGFHYTQYDLQNAGPGLPGTPTRSLPYGRLDAGLVFEREVGSSGQRTQTLEPRIVYSYAPYRNQNELPIFDTAVPDLNLTELFRSNRYVGDDRISDADQVAIGVTSRLFDSVSGAQYLSASIGQIRYISIPRVNIPDDQCLLNVPPTASQPGNLASMPNPLYSPQLFVPTVRAQNPNGQTYQNCNGQLVAYQPGQLAEQYPASDIISEIALTAYKHVSVNLDYQWNPYTSHTDKEEVGVQYHPDNARVFNLSYRFQSGILKQYDGSFVWPIGGRWNTIGRWVYSLQDRETIEQVAGIEYKSCCYRIQIVQRRYLQRPTDGAPPGTAAGLSSSIALQLELTGLSSVGKPADSFLQKEIPGYPVPDSKASDPNYSVP